MLYLLVYKLFRCMNAGAEDAFPIEFGVKIDTFPILCREKGGEMAGCLPGSIPIFNLHDAALGLQSPRAQRVLRSNSAGVFLHSSAAFLHYRR